MIASRRSTLFSHSVEKTSTTSVIIGISALPLSDAFEDAEDDKSDLEESKRSVDKPPSRQQRLLELLGVKTKGAQGSSVDEEGAENDNIEHTVTPPIGRGRDHTHLNQDVSPPIGRGIHDTNLNQMVSPPIGRGRHATNLNQMVSPLIGRGRHDTNLNQMVSPHIGSSRHQTILNQRVSPPTGRGRHDTNLDQMVSPPIGRGTHMASMDPQPASIPVGRGAQLKSLIHGVSQASKIPGLFLLFVMLFKTIS